MTCYKPLLRIELQNSFKQAKDGHLYKNASIEHPDDLIRRLEEIKDTKNIKYQVIPCRNCIGCRLDYSRDWANRGFLEAKYHKNTYFITLTYDEIHIPYAKEIKTKDGQIYKNNGEWKGTLKDDDLTKFLKKLRQNQKREYDKTFKFMACGEYGEDTARPHWHLIIFGLELPLNSFYEPRIINGEIYYQNKEIERCWKKGISNITEATWNTIAYTARYITKKVNGKNAEEIYASKGQIKEIFRMSKGIGKQYYEEHKDMIKELDGITVRNKKGIVTEKPPKYFDNLHKKEDEEHYEIIKEKRLEMKRANDKIKDNTTSLTRLQQLAVEEKTKQNAGLKLPRKLKEFQKNT